MKTSSAAVWISRPRRRAALLARELRRWNLNPIVKPAVRIVGARNAHFNLFLARPDFYDLAIFVSEEAANRCQTAAMKTNAKTAAAKIAKKNKNAIPSLAIGDATLAALKNLPMCAPIRTTAGDSLALLHSPHLRAEKIVGKKIAVVGGAGREKEPSPRLCAALRQRGAEVFCAIAYRRVPSLPDAKFAAKVSENLCAAVAYSGDTAANMLAMTAPQNSRLRKSPLFVIHPQIAAAARKMGYCNVRTAPAAAEQMAKKIAKYLQSA